MAAATTSSSETAGSIVACSERRRRPSVVLARRPATCLTGAGASEKQATAFCNLPSTFARIDCVSMRNPLWRHPLAAIGEGKKHLTNQDKGTCRRRREGGIGHDLGHCHLHSSRCRRQPWRPKKGGPADSLRALFITAFTSS